MNTNSVENIILELDQISSLCSKIGSVYRSIDILESKKNAELEKTKKVREITINRSLRAFKEEQLAKLPEWNATHDYISTWPPTHWSYPSSSKRDFKTEKTLDSFSSPEMKEQIYNSFREYEKSFIKIMKVCEEKGKTEWDAFHAELAAINSKYEKMKEELDAKKDTLEMEMNKHTVISSDLFYLAGEISLLLKQKRADTLKEAINLATDDGFDGKFDPIWVIFIALAVVFLADWMVYCYEKYQLR